MNLHIITDSCCDLDKEMIRDLEVSVAPLVVNHEGGSFADGTMEAATFYDNMRSGIVYSTSAVNPEGWIQVMEPKLKEHKDLLVLAFSSAMSTTYQSAVIAAAELQEKYPQARIAVVDTRSASVGQGLLVCHAARQAKEGKNLEEVRGWVLAHLEGVAHWVTVDDLKYLKRGGRISAATAVVGTMLSIKPIIHVDEEGKLSSVDKTRGRKAALQHVADKLAQTITEEGKEMVFISHADCLEDAEAVAALVKERGVKEVVISSIGSVVGSHTGPGCIALCFLATGR